MINCHDKSEKSKVKIISKDYVAKLAGKDVVKGLWTVTGQGLRRGREVH